MFNSMPEAPYGTTHLQVSWRGTAIAGSCLSLGLATTLIIVATVRDAGALETVALVLAVVAFVSQLMIFIAQVGVTTTQLQQAERVNSETSALLADLSSRLARLDETQFQQFTEIRQQLLPRALGEQMVDSIDRAVDDVAKADPRLATQLETALSGVRKTIEARTEREYFTEQVPCQFCPNTSVIVRIGSVAGDSAVGDCRECGNRFHVHRDKDGNVFTARPGNPRPTSDDPEEILRRNEMQLPDLGDRLRILSQFVDEWRQGAVRKGRDVTAWMDYPSKVRTPFFFALVNHDYGPLSLSGSNDTRVADRDVAPPSAPLDDDEWLVSAHAAWIAQALYRLRGWRRTRQEELLYFFGPDAGDQEREVLDLAHEYDQRARVRSELDVANTVGPADDGSHSLLSEARPPTSERNPDQSDG
jgi:hypothetical protein